MELITMREFDYLQIGEGQTQCLSNGRRIFYVTEPVFTSLASLTGDKNSPFRFTREAKKLQANGVAGVVPAGNHGQVEILPKIVSGKEVEENDANLKRIFFNMLQTVPGFNIIQQNDAFLRVDSRPIFEIYISAFIKTVEKLVRYGIKANYVPISENLNVFRGRLSSRDNIRENLLHPERFFVSYEDYLINRPENRLIKTAIQWVSRISKDNTNLVALRRLNCYFDEVPLSTHIKSDLASIRIDRTIGHYEHALAWTKMILANESPVTSSGESEVPAFIFSMDKLFEAYVAVKMRRLLYRENVPVKFQAQATGKALFDEPKIFRLRPDILLTDLSGKPKIVMDTKWKVLVDDKSKNYGISQGDMYQMFAYSKKFNVPDIYVIYPESVDFSDEFKELVFTSGAEAERTTIHVRFVDLRNVDASLEKLLSDARVLSR